MTENPLNLILTIIKAIAPLVATTENSIRVVLNISVLTDAKADAWVAIDLDFTIQNWMCIPTSVCSFIPKYRNRQFFIKYTFFVFVFALLMFHRFSALQVYLHLIVSEYQALPLASMPLILQIPLAGMCHVLQKSIAIGCKLIPLSVATSSYSLNTPYLKLLMTCACVYFHIGHWFTNMPCYCWWFR